jgi:7-cyano-7-deazaguanine tRNA-ribosyltransferase
LRHPFFNDEMFEIIHHDGLARVGKLHTAHGIVTTPTLMPVINPADIFLTPTEMNREFGTELVITNAYLIMRRYGEEGIKRGVHEILGYEGPIFTDSGGYQVLRYGGIDVSPEEMIRYQDGIIPDIATILDVPTGIGVSRERAEETVHLTLERAKQAIRQRSNPNVMWCGPVQGGLFLDLVKTSARKMGKLDFHIHAVGSPVELMEDYRYAELVDLVMTAKQNLPLDRPVHLFGAGHPMMLALGVAMGCDLFDSAAYALYAKDERYMTVHGTLKLKELTCFPCECPVCVGGSPDEVRKLPPFEKIKFLAKHNLHVTFGEVRRIRQAIIQGRFWEHLELRCRTHPRLLDGLRRLLKYKGFIERFDPVTKPSAFFYVGAESVGRPEVFRYTNRLKRYSPPPLPVLALVSGSGDTPKLEEPAKTHLVRIVLPFGVVPEELNEVYPLRQFVAPRKFDRNEIEAAAKSIEEYLKKYGTKYKRVILYNDEEVWGTSFVKACRVVRKKLKVVRL